METMLSGRNIEPAIVEQPIGSGASVESIHIELVPDHQQELMHEEEQRGTARKSVRNSVRTSVRTSTVRSSKEVAETDESDLRDSSDYVEIIDRQESEHDEEEDDLGELEILLEENEREEEPKEIETMKNEAERKERNFWAGMYNEGFNNVVEIVEEEKKETVKKDIRKEKKVPERKLGRFNDAVSEVVERFTESVTKEADELYMHDIVGSRAHVKMLGAMVCLIILAQVLLLLVLFNLIFL